MRIKGSHVYNSQNNRRIIVERLTRVKKKHQKKAPGGLSLASMATRDRVLALVPTAQARRVAGHTIADERDGNVIRVIPDSYFVIRADGEHTARISSARSSEGAAWHSAKWRLTEYDGRAWSILTTHPQAEADVLEYLAELGIEAYAPNEVVWQNGPQRRRAVTRPLLPGYVFAVINPEQIHQSRSAGVSGVLDGVCAVADLAEFVVSLREAETAGEFDHTFRQGKTLKLGQKVRVIKGSWVNEMGVLSKMKGEKRAEIMVHAMNREIPVSVALDELEAA